MFFLVVKSLGYNLISAGELMEDGYALISDNGACSIKRSKSCAIISKINMSANRVFPINVTQKQVQYNYQIITNL